jgi:hypothetical protein
MEQTKKQYSRSGVLAQYGRNCAQKKWPMFVRESCYRCGNEVVMEEAERIMEKGYCEITGCRRCGRSFVD